MARTATGQVVERDGRRGTTYAVRFRAYGERHYLTLGSREEGWTRKRAETELQNILADVRRGSWKPPKAEPVATPQPDPTFHEFASEWLASRRDELAARTVEDYTLALTHHLLPFFAEYRLTAITAREVDRYKASKLRAREQFLVQRPLSNRTINKHLIRLGQILDAAVRYELLEYNPVKTRVKKLKEAEPRRARMTGEQVQMLLRAAGPNRVLLATAIMAGGLRASELTHLRWRDLDLGAGELRVATSKTAAGMRSVTLEPELVKLLREHRVASRWSQDDDFVFPGRIRSQPRERNSLRTRVLHGAIARANVLLAADGRPPLPDGLTFHSLRRTYAALRAELGEHPSITAVQMGHRDPRMTLRVYTDVSAVRPKTRLGGVLGDTDWAQMGTNADEGPDLLPRAPTGAQRETGPLAATSPYGSDGTRTRDLRRDRPAL